RLKELGIELPQAAVPVASYIPFVISGNLVFVSGQLPFRDGEVAYSGKVGGGISLEDGQAAARLCGLNLIAQVRNACGGNLDRVTRVVRLGGFVNCAPDFTDQPQVINGASDLMMEVFGEAGKHARAAVGAPSLPRGAAVEVEGVFEVSG
ncbi:MAG: RidA family protein, partial [Rhodospirillales bacterium]|nr:RidA family protein [Rhodospirillales bacterium]